MRRSGYNSFRDTGLQAVCDSTDAFIQETLLYSRDGYTSIDGKVHWTPTQYWSKHVLKDTFTRDDDEADNRSWRLIDDNLQPYTVQANHRGDGKTARSAALITRLVCYRMVRFLLYLQANYEDAATEMDNVKTELLTNDFIKAVFRFGKPETVDDLKKTFGKRAYFMCEPDATQEPFVFILPRGAGQNIRGRTVLIKKQRVRPELVIADDLENDTLVLDEENRRKLRSWWHGSVMPVVRQDVFPEKDNRWRKPADADETWFPPFRFLFNGTPLHHDSLLVNLMSSTQWKAVRNPLGIVEGEGDNIRYISVRPSRISTEKLQALAEQARKDRVLDEFYREKLCLTTSKEYSCWTADMFKYFTQDRDAQLQNDKDVIRFVIVDPSKSASQHADLTGILAVAVNPRSNMVYIRRAVAEHLKSADVAKRATEIAVETNSQMIFVEIIGQVGVTDENFTNQVTKRGLPIQLFWLNQGHTPKGDYGTGKDAIKRWRAQQVLPYYQDGEVWHHISLQNGAMEMHMKDYPNPADWCLTDCAGYIPACMHEIGVVFGKVEKYDNITRFPMPENSREVDDFIRSGAWQAV